MGLFSFFNRQPHNDQAVAQDTASLMGDIPEDIFVEKEQPGTTQPEEKQNGTPINSIHLLYDFLDKNYESKGYNDALINPDNTHLDQNIVALKNDLERSIRKVKTYYEDFIRQINFHIASRSRSGMVDTVEELAVKKEIAESHIKQVIEIEEQARNDEGVGHGIIISYTRGFRNGLAAISGHSILNKHF
ncbi:hypothetical protein HNQ91_000912 [Filimonas zeae]|uniref:Uncharacterized protein n=1 Tax=Filimonas zeae TaxID=1737353 RepID=A0A917MS32_9BACT|nr:hypothetical protein [Filimonas zeae]MDR6337890.1 hypothetical protein [Filimonas zeae]GGH60737.1 hypothetical protein GCM10011379_08930 [Filimonas zeae]